MVKARDYTGEKYGKLTAIKVSENKTPRGAKLWEFVCDCGNPHLAEIGDVKKSNTIGCKDCNIEQTASRYRTHGRSGGKSRAYQAWKGIKKRCLNPNDARYATYSSLGIDDLYVNNPERFIEDLGEPPVDGNRYSVDRIDNKLGYMVGNIRWATDSQQAHNKNIRHNSKTGITGVYYTSNNGIKRYVATWMDVLTNKSKSTSFSSRKYGEELSFFLACEARVLMIEKMNNLGAQYSPTHGL